MHFYHSGMGKGKHYYCPKCGYARGVRIKQNKTYCIECGVLAIELIKNPNRLEKITNEVRIKIGVFRYAWKSKKR